MMGEEKLRCKDCKWCVPERWVSVDGIIELVGQYVCGSLEHPVDSVNPGQFACRWFVYK